MFNFLTFDIFLTTWHLLTFWHITCPVPHCPCAPSPCTWLPAVPHCQCGLYPCTPYPLYPIANCTSLPMCLILLYPIAHVPHTPCTHCPCGFPRNCIRKDTKNTDVSNFRHVFASYRPLVAKLFHILVEEVISFKMSGVTSKSVKN